MNLNSGKLFETYSLIASTKQDTVSDSCEITSIDEEIRYIIFTENVRLIYLGQVVYPTSQIAGAMSHDAPLLFSHCCLVKGAQQIPDLYHTILKVRCLSQPDTV